MKLLKSMVVVSVIALISLPFSGCDSGVASENCEQQDMNEILNCGAETNVEVCCEIGAACVYKYNGQDYPDTEAGLNDLADALGCTYKSSEDNDAQKELIIKLLIELKERVRYMD